MTVCTKLLQWMTLAGVFFSVWTALIVDALPVEISKEAHQVILIVSYSLVSMLLYWESSMHFFHTASTVLINMLWGKSI